MRDPALFAVPDDQAGPGDLRCAMFAYDCTPPLAPVAGTYTGCTVRTDSYLQPPGHYADFLRAIKDPS